MKPSRHQSTRGRETLWVKLPLVLLILALVVGGYLRLDAASHPYLSQWDEAYHALVAKNLAEHPLAPTLYDEPLQSYDYREWRGNHIWLHKPPLPLWMMALSIRLFGDGELAVRLPSVALGLLMITLVYAMAGRLWGEQYRWAGAIAAVMLALNPLLIRLASGTIPTDHIDTHTAFFAQLAVFAALRVAQASRGGWICTLGAVLGLGFLCKSLAALIIVPVCLVLVWPNRRRWGRSALHLARAVISFLIVALPWQIYSASRWPREYEWESAYTLDHLFKSVEGHAQPFFYYFSLIPTHYGGIAWMTVLLIAAAVVGGVLWAVRQQDRNIGALALWVLLPYILFSLVGTKLNAYVAPTIPAVTLLIGWAVVRIVRSSAIRRVSRAPGGAVFLCLLVTIQIGSVAAERFEADYDPCPWNVVYDHIAFRTELKRIARAPGQKIIFNVDDWKEIQAMYYARCPAYPNVPTADHLSDLHQRGFQVYFLIDAFGRNQEQIATLHQAGLLERVQGVRLPGPRPGPSRHPYYN